MKKLAIFTAIAFASAAVMAQATLKVSTGSASGNYSRIFKEMAETCKNEIPLQEANSSGSNQNVDRLVGNEVNGIFTQTDVIFSRGQTEDLSEYKTLFSLYPEEVHVLTTAVSKIEEGGFGGIGAKAIQLNSVESLAGRTIAAWGGSITSAEVIRLQSEISYKVVDTGDFKTAKAALDAGKVAAIMMVGGNKLSDIAALDGSYKLLPFSEASVGKLKRVYSPATVTYTNLGAGGRGVKTVSTDALFVVRAYKSPKFVESMAALRGCVYSNLVTLAETTGKHPKWRMVKAENEGKWAYYQLPTKK